MPAPKEIPAQIAQSLGLHVGDSFSVLGQKADGSLLIEPLTSANAQRSQTDSRRGKERVARALAALRGAVQLKPGETIDDVRMAYYREKYGVQ